MKRTVDEQDYRESCVACKTTSFFVAVAWRLTCVNVVVNQLGNQKLSKWASPAYLGRIASKWDFFTLPIFYFHPS